MKRIPLLALLFATWFSLIGTVFAYNGLFERANFVALMGAMFVLLAIAGDVRKILVK